MGAKLRQTRRRIRSIESTKRITKAMELIAASRIIKAQGRAQSAAPYARELTKAVSAVASLNSLVGLPNPTVNFDLNLAVAVGF